MQVDPSCFIIVSPGPKRTATASTVLWGHMTRLKLIAVKGTKLELEKLKKRIMKTLNDEGMDVENGMICSKLLINLMSHCH